MLLVVNSMAHTLRYARVVVGLQSLSRNCALTIRARAKASSLKIAALSLLLKRVTDNAKKLESEKFSLGAGEGVVDAINANKGRSFLITGKRFNEAEIEVIRQAFHKSLFAANFEVVKSKVLEKVESWVAEVEKYSSAAVTFNKVADRVMRQYQEALNTEFDTNGHDPFDSLFTNPDEPETGVPDRFDPDRFYRREGSLLAVLYVLAATDVHFENIVAAGEDPV